LKHPWRNGTTDVVFEPQDLIAKLAALVPAPRTHLTRYSGVFGPAAKWRPLIIPSPVIAESAVAPPRQDLSPPSTSADSAIETASHDHRPKRTNHTWAQLMMRVFQLDVLECENCGGRLRIITAIHPPDTTRKILDCLGLPSRAPPLAPAICEVSPDYF
jgi:hypothetical protein